MSDVKTGTVKSITFNKEWGTGVKATNYYDVEFTNGDKGSIGCKVKGSIKEGDTFNYTTDIGVDGVSLNIRRVYDKPFDNTQGSAPSNPNPASRPNIGGYKTDPGVGAMVGNSISNAVNIINANDKYTLDDLMAIADTICEVSGKLKEKYSK
jgi:hypothetical protein